MKLEKRNVIITGGTLGLGAALVSEFIKEGANVLFCSRNAEAGKILLKEFQTQASKGQKIIYQACDVSKPKEIDQLFRCATKEFKTLHGLVNNAGIYGPIGPSEEVPYDEWVQAIEINLFGTFLACRKTIPIFKKNSYGKIINLSGGGATNPLPRFTAYAASKVAVVRLTETLAEELRDFHIDVNAVSPGALNTRLLDQVLKAGPQKAGKSFYERSLKQAAEGGAPVEKGVRLCVYLASAESDGITGKLISAIWDPWEGLHTKKESLTQSDIYCLRRIIPKDRGQSWG